MNKIYRLIWSEITRTWVAVSEITRGRGKRASGVVGGIGVVGWARFLCPRGIESAWAQKRAHPTILALAIASIGTAYAGPAPTQLPTGGQLVAGSASTAQNGSTLNINQSSNRAALNWQTFNIGSAATVNFNQPSTSSVTLNQVLDSNPSQIYGHLNANGQVFFTNPNGMYFAPGASANVGGLVATTNTISLTDFMAGNYRFGTPRPQAGEGQGRGSVINDGNLTASLGGYIALLAPQVRNNGVIVAQLGTVALAAGEAYTLQFDGNNLLSNIIVTPATIKALVENGNAVQAPGGLIILSAQAADRLQGGVVNNSGTLEATGLTSNGGIIRLSASDTINDTGSIHADAAPNSSGNGGTVSLIANLANAGSSTTIDGSISARGGNLASVPSPAGGGLGRGSTSNGGFVETSGGKVQIGSSARVDTSAPQGNIGSWLLDPNDFTIASSGGNITGSQLDTMLISSSVTIQTTTGTNTSTNLYTSTFGSGNINVNDNVNWNANNLTLTAANNINVNAVMTMTGNSTLTMTTGGSGTVNMGFDTGGTFKGRIDLPGRSGIYLSDNTTPILTINNNNYSIINSLGVAGDATSGSNPTLQAIAQSGNMGGYFALGSDIDASATASWGSGASAGFNPIGTSVTQFFGQFDGLGHTIDGLTIARSSTDNVGLFGYVGSGGQLCNVALTNASVTGQSNVGVLAGDFSSAASNNFYVQGTSTGSGTGNDVGGLIGNINTTTAVITNAHAAVTVTSPSNSLSTGGLIGNGQGTVVNSYATGNVSGYSQVGGLIGTMSDGSITNSYATGTVSANDTAGGLIGRAGPSTLLTIYNSYATGNVSTTGTNGSWADTGGFVGELDNNVTIQNAFATGNVTGTGGGMNGGFAGYVTNPGSGTSISYAFATGNVNSSGSFPGSFSGYNFGTMNYVYATGTVNGATVASTSNFVAGGNAATNSSYTFPTLTPITWSGGGSDTLWTNTANWAGGVVPTIFNTAVLGGATVSVPSIVMAGNVTASNHSVINFTGNLVSSLTIGETGTVTLGAYTNGASDNGNVTINYGTSGEVNLPSASLLRLNNIQYTVITLLTAPTLTPGYEQTSTTGTDLQGINGNLGGKYVLGLDINASATSGWNSNAGFTPIGSYGSSTPFTGVLNGFGHSVNSLTIGGSNSAVGLFGYTDGATLKNLGVVAANISGQNGVGGLVGFVSSASAASTLTNLWSVGGKIQGANYVGGLAGNVSGSSNYGISIANS